MQVQELVNEGLKREYKIILSLEQVGEKIEAVTKKIAKEVNGSHFIELSGFGHFPMIENPSGLIPYLVEPLRDIHNHKKSRK